MREEFLRCLPHVREVSGRPVTIAERRAAMNLPAASDDNPIADRTRNFLLSDSSSTTSTSSTSSSSTGSGTAAVAVDSALFARWAASDAPRSHSLFVPVQAEFAHETDRMVKLSFRDGDDLSEIAARFCAAHGITEAAAGCAELVATMTEMIDEPPERAVAACARGWGTGGRSGGGGGDAARGEGKEATERARRRPRS